MRKTLVIASREFQASVRTKSFIISLLAMPLFMGGSILVQVLLKDVGDTKEKIFAIVDRTEGQQLYPKLVEAKKEGQEAAEKFKEALEAMDDSPMAKKAKKLDINLNFDLVKVKPSPHNAQAINKQRFELSERVRKGELFGFVEIGAKVLDPLAVTKVAPAQGKTAKDKKPADMMTAMLDQVVIRYQTNTPTYDAFPRWLESEVNKIVRKIRAQKEKIPKAKLDAITQQVTMLPKGLSEAGADGEIQEAKEQNQVAAFLVPFGLTMLMFMVIMIGATPLMQGIVEEKMQRIAEVLLGSVRPFDLMMGKLLGMVGVSLTLVAVYMSGAYWAAHYFGFAEFLPVPLLVWFFLFQILAVLMYGSLFIAVGAACTDTKETQTMLMPVMMVACIPMFVIGNILREPNSSFAVGISLFPFATPMLMIARMAIPPGVDLWQPLVGIGVVLLATFMCVYAAGRIFRVGILMQGKGAKFTEIVKWVFKG